MLQVGDKLGSYEIVAPLRAGGMATLFLARRAGAAGFSRHVAIKVARAELVEDPQFARMFVDEAKLSAQIQHPNVVHVEEFGESEGTYFLVMEYIDGGPLAQLLAALAAQGRRLAPEVAVFIAAQLAEGLHAAHECRGDAGEALEIVHRDVSPQNVLVSFDGYVKLIDFGISKARGRVEQTRPGTLRGKLGYMAPEQAAGEGVDRRTDVYALGVVLWEMLTGRRLFEAESEVGLLREVLAPRITPPRELVSELPAALDAAVVSALAADPARRPRSARAFRDLLVAAVPTALSIGPAQLGQLMGAVIERRPLGLIAPPPSELPTGNPSAADPMAVAPTDPATALARWTRVDAGISRTIAPPRARRAPWLAAGALAVAAGAAFALLPRMVTPPASAPSTRAIASAAATPALAPAPAAPLPTAAVPAVVTATSPAPTVPVSVPAPAVARRDETPRERPTRRRTHRRARVTRRAPPAAPAPSGPSTPHGLPLSASMGL